MAYKGPKVVTGPSSSTDNTVPRYDGTSGEIVQTSGVSITDADICNGITQLNVDNIRVDGNTISSTDTNGNVTIAPDGTGVVSVTTAPIVPSGDRADSLGSATNSWDNVYCDGVSFDDGTNVLATYEVGTWTPVLAFGGGSTGITYSQQEGRYTRIGNVVFYFYQISLTSKGSSTGASTVSGLPYTVGGSTADQTGGFGHWGSIDLDTSQTTIVHLAAVGGTILYPRECGDNTGVDSIADTQFANTSVITAQGFYYV